MVVVVVVIMTAAFGTTCNSKGTQKPHTQPQTKQISKSLGRTALPRASALPALLLPKTENYSPCAAKLRPQQLRDKTEHRKLPLEHTRCQCLECELASAWNANLLVACIWGDAMLIS